MCSSKENPGNDQSCSSGDFLTVFLKRYKKEFGFMISDRKIIVDDIRVRGVAKSITDLTESIDHSSEPPTPEKTVQAYFDTDYQLTNVYLLEKLCAGQQVHGPSIIIDENSTVLVEPDCIADVTTAGCLLIKIGAKSRASVGTELDSIQLSIFSHRFMSIAEQMGRILQRTSISTNIKERLDFSCAMFGPDGGLVANAPHIPVHLGAMQETVQYQIRHIGGELEDGDVILSNHPSTGGSHLPDLTVITPVFYRSSKKPVFFVASRGHHADIGGSTPGSMPPHSNSIFQEGAVFKSFFLVKRGIFQEKEVTEALMAPSQYEGCSGTRNLRDNLSDLQAQVAANNKGIYLIQELIDEYGLNVVQAYMSYIQSNAELAVRSMLSEIATKTRLKTGVTSLHAEDYMDDGSKISLHININEEKGSAVFDFTGSGYEVYGNCNAPRAVTLSAIIYCLRCLVQHDVPLNQGCMKPIQVIIPKGSILDPSDTAAVVGGNVLTSQRVVDVIFKAFSTCAASQGCMNNITFGDYTSGYYETVAGGAGAGPSWHGRHGVHSHMTNTRITDPEILERRYPVILKSFHLNPGTGGKGNYNGGDGVLREMMFRKSFTLSILTERRVFQPYGIQGGESGRRGRNTLLRADGRKIGLSGKVSVEVKAGDVFRLETPGGGGYGAQYATDPLKTPPTKPCLSTPSPGFTVRGSVNDFKVMQETA